MNTIKSVMSNSEIVFQARPDTEPSRALQYRVAA